MKPELSASAPARAEPKASLLFWCCVLASLALGFAVITHLAEPIGDEAVHAFQINWFIDGTYRIFEYITVVPVYHAANAALATLLGDNALNTLRFANLVLSAAAIPAFIALVRRLHPAETAARSLQFVFLPFYFPLFFVIYTDLFSLAFVLMMLERTLARSYRAAALFALVAIFARQPNLVWLGYAGVLVLFEQGRPEWTPRFIAGYVRRAWPLMLAGLAFLVFVFVNGGVAVGDSEQHPVSFNPTNFWFFLIVAFVLFLPYCLARAADVASLLMAHKWVGLLIAGLFPVYLDTWELAHIYNDRSLGFYLHNLVLNTIDEHLWLKVASYVAIAWMGLAFAAAARAETGSWALRWLLPFAALSIVPLPLVEQRYYLVPLCLFLALRPPVPTWASAVTLGCYVTGAAYLLHNVSRMNFFL